VSMASVALARGINANLLRRWVRDAEGVPAMPASVARPPALLALPSIASSLGQRCHRRQIQNAARKHSSVGLRHLASVVDTAEPHTQV
jgi:transposase-like protein